MDRAFLEQLEACRAELIGLCRGLLWDRNDLEDALQEVVVQALSAYRRFTPGTDFRRWIFRVATLTVFNINRRRRPVPAPAPEPEANLEQELGLEETYETILKDPDRVVAVLGKDLRQGLEQLNETERVVFLLRSLCDLKYQDIAQTLGIPLGSVMGNLGRARAKLRRALAEYAHEV